MTTLSVPTELAVLAQRIHSAWGVSRRGQVEAWRGYFTVGELLIKARSEFPADQEYGRWFAAQDFGFSSQWGRKMIEAAEHRDALEPLLDTAVTSNVEPPGLRAMLSTIAPPRPTGPNAPKEDIDPLDHPMDVIGYDEYGAPLGWVEKETAEHLYTVEFVGRLIFKVPSDKTRMRGDKEGMPRESVDSEAARAPIYLKWTVAEREAGWEGLARVTNAIRRAIMEDPVIRRDWPRIPRHGERK